MHLLPERLIEWKVVGGWATVQARRTTHGRFMRFTGGRFTSAWWNSNPGGWRAALATGQRCRPLMGCESFAPVSKGRFGSIRRFQIDQKKANIAQISLLREICALFAVFFFFIIIKIKKMSPKPE